ncbi:MAG TPA: TMEM165/GDT1 family protein [Thermoplasmata archaeon]|nr:TMEM165/GDT1 family protein [Thermoplasmata archaeon]
MALSLLAGFVLTFAVIAGTEFIDRTNFALIGLAAKHPPFSVWSGAAAAFLVTTALAVAIGTLLITALQGQVVYLRLGGGIFLVGYAVYLAFVPEKDRTPPTGRTAFSTAFLLILLLEIGDTTMIFTINFLLIVPNPLVVYVAAALALVGVAASGALIGSRLGAKVEPKTLERLIVVILAAVGIATILYALFPGWFPSLF